MLWFYVLVIAAVAAAFWFYRTRRRVGASYGGRQATLSETSAEIGVPPEVVDKSQALLSDRLAGVQRPMVSEPQSEIQEPNARQGALGDMDLRKDNLSKEVELDWEAAKIIERPLGAYAGPKDRVGVPKEARSTDSYNLPQSYGKERLVLMARDPSWVFAYWEQSRERVRELREKRLSEWGLSRPVLRLYDVSDPSVSPSLDVEVRDGADNWYVNVNRPRHRLVGEIGRMFPDGFVALVRSNEVSLPPISPSMEISEEWAPVGWDKNYGKFTSQVGTSSPGEWVK